MAEATPAKKDYVVKHPKLTLMVKGEMTEVKKGTRLKLTEAQAEKMGRRVVPYVEAETIDTKPEDNTGDKKDGDDGDTKDAKTPPKK